MFKIGLLQFFTILSVLFVGAISSENVVPVFFWENFSNAPLVPALEKISEKSFENIISDNLQDARLLVFVENSLSPEDFLALKSIDKDSKSKLTAVKEGNSVSYFPFVQNPVKVVKHTFPNALEISLSDLLNDESILENNKVIIVKLDDALENEDGLDRFKRHAFKAFEIYDKVAKKNTHVTGLLTGYKGSWVAPETEILSRRVREVNSTSDNRALYYTNNVLLYVNSSIVYFSNGSEYIVNNGSFTTTTSNDSIIATLSGNNVNAQFNFTSSNGYWYLSSLTVNEQNLAVTDVYAPHNFSYTCNKTVFTSSSNSVFNLSLPGFQVQPFFGVNQAGSFGDPYNCVGFTTIPIWSGLFVTFIICLIMTFALTFLIDIRTMDRFDDPKGKTITVNVSE